MNWKFGLPGFACCWPTRWSADQVNAGTRGAGARGLGLSAAAKDRARVLGLRAGRDGGLRMADQRLLGDACRGPVHLGIEEARPRAVYGVEDEYRGRRFADDERLCAGCGDRNHTALNGIVVDDPAGSSD